jgi:hypothetical protein
MREGDQSIFNLMGYLAPYRPSDGFGVDEWPLPDGAEILQVQVSSRHFFFFFRIVVCVCDPLGR